MGGSGSFRRGTGKLCIGREGLRSEVIYVQEQMRLRMVARSQREAMKVEMDERRLAFAMALHNRLGESSIAHCLDEITMRGIVAHPVVEDVMIAIDDA